MDHDVFISYSSRDKLIADAACATLEKKIRCWIAPRDVLPGVPYGEALMEGITGCSILVLVFSSQSNNSPQVMREVERAVSKGITIIPFRVEDVAPSKSMEYFISGTHWLDALTPPLEQHLQHLARTVQLLLSRRKPEGQTDLRQVADEMKHRAWPEATAPAPLPPAPPNLPETAPPHTSHLEASRSRSVRPLVEARPTKVTKLIFGALSNRLSFTRGHIVICGLGRIGIQLIKDFRALGDKVIAVESDGASDLIPTCRELGATVLVGNASETVLLRKAHVEHCRYLIAACGNDATNVEIATSASQFLRSDHVASEEITTCYLHIVNPQLAELLNHHPAFTDSDGTFRIQVFNLYQNSARAIFDEKPLDRVTITPDDERVVQLIVVGMGEMGKAVFLQAAKIAHFANGKLPRVTIVDNEASKAKRFLYDRYPRLDEVCEMDILDARIEDSDMLSKVIGIASDPRYLTTIAVCCDDDTFNISFALGLLHKQSEIPILVRTSTDTGVSSLLQTGPLVFRSESRLPC